jgi:hypothetical protein
LNLYSDISPPCKVFNNLVSQSDNFSNPKFYLDNGFKGKLPWIKYMRPYKNVVSVDARVKFRASFGFEDVRIGIISNLKFFLAKYNLDGNFLGWEKMSNQLIVCDYSMEDVQRIYQIGTTVQLNCTYDVSKLFSKSKYDRPENENVFYELYLQDYNGDMIDVPVLI